MVIIYARVSTEEQHAEGYSIPAQVDLCRDYARKHGIRVDREIVEAESASKTGRVGFNEMVAALKRTKERIILVEKTDRLYRNLKDFVTIDDLGVVVHFVKENTVISPDSMSNDQFVHGLNVLLARRYTKNLSEECSKGLRKKAELGLYPSWAPLGYVNREKGIAPDPDRAPLILRMFEMRAAGATLDQVWEMTKREGLRNRGGSILQRSHVSKMLVNPIYRGDFIWGGKQYEGKHEPIVSRDLFERATNLHRPGRRRKHVWAFQGLLRCRCGRLFTAERQAGRHGRGDYVYYHCTRAKCGEWIREDRLDELLLPIVERVAIPAAYAERIAEALKEAQATRVSWQEGERARVRNARQMLETRQEAVYEALLDRGANHDVLERLRGKIEAELDSLAAAEERMSKGTVEHFETARQVLELTQSVFPMYVTKSPTEKARLLKTLVSKLIIDGATVEATYEKPFDILVKGLSDEAWYRYGELNPGLMAENHLS